ncbi:AraC family transcriptional regulator [Agromyces lapidis]|uniref:Helix-turn-helix domain-containing protein n=1 Tax=Agromyces lapidis TaxID=279574 RepID=A0ABV5SNB6_9MICO|nr:AraC family transcriptional regulator [Agromyces lapidis]
MDETPLSAPSHRAEGFANQRLAVVPRPQLDAAARAAGARHLVVSDAGYFPVAAGHRRARPNGSPETIVIVCVAGSGRVCIADTDHALVPGSWVAIPAGIPHEYQASEATPWTIWWLHARGTDIAELTGPLLGRPQPVARLRSIDRVVALFDELVTLLERRPSPAQQLAASGIAWHLLARLSVDAVQPADGSPLERAMRYLEARVDGTVSVAELAAIVGLSPSHLGTQFRRATGGGPGAFHTSLKMARARSLLDTTTMPVTAVASAVGYADPLYFSRSFRRVHGVSPTSYRAQRKG